MARKKGYDEKHEESYWQWTPHFNCLHNPKERDEPGSPITYAHVEAVVDTSAENNPNEGEDASIEDKTASIEQNDTGILYFETSSEDGSVDLRAQKKAKTE